MNNPDYYILYEVWDPLLRLLHWLNAICVLILIVLGGTLYLRDTLELTTSAVDLIASFHVYTGYILAAVVLIRWIWLFTGPPLSTWQDIVPHKKGQIKVLKDTIRFYLKMFKVEPPFYVAHNPFAGMAYMVFFVVVGIQIIEGLILSQTPLSQAGVRDAPELLVMSHRIGFVIIILFVIAHIVALVVHELVERRSIVSSMIHGSKVFRLDELERVDQYIKSLKKEGER